MNLKNSIISFFNIVSNFLERKVALFSKLTNRLQLQPITKKGIAISLITTLLIGMGFSGYKQLQTGWGYPVDILLGLTIGLIAMSIGYITIRLIVSLLSKLSDKLSALTIAVYITLLLLLWVSPETGYILIGILIIAAFTLGGTIATATAPAFKFANTGRKLWISSLFILSISAFVVLFWWLVQSGTDNELVKVKIPETSDIHNLSASDPTHTGPFKVVTLTYGNGKDRRAEFGEEATIKTTSVNGKPFTGEAEGKLSFLREKYWNFDQNKLPVNGRVWYPKGDGPFPLVLIVHGNHSMREYSDTGYDYLGELLASRGYIFVSVDENFLNGDWTGNYQSENDARGWLLLEHIKIWSQWNGDHENPFYQKVDLNQIALMGHSRGGEAVSIAAAFNKLKHYPDDARILFDYGFNIRSVIAIAPIDGQYEPTRQSTPLEDINYLLLQGSHDTDVSFFSGDRQFKRIKFTNGDDCFKTSIYIYRANHGQFNTVWGNRDYGFPLYYLLNTKPLLQGEEQRQIAKVYISAFLDATLKGDRQYIPLFRDYRNGIKWLPDTYFINRYEDSNTQYICDYDEDINLNTSTVKGGNLQGKALANWKEMDIGFRNGNPLRQNQAVCLGWEYQIPDSTSVVSDSISSAKRINKHQIYNKDSLKMFEPASYSITLPQNLTEEWKVDSSTYLTFAIAQLDESPSAPLDLKEDSEDKSNQKVKVKKNKVNKEKVKSKENQEEEKSIETIDFTIELKDENGETIKLSMREILPLMPPLKAKFTRYGLMEKWFNKSSEPILQTVEIPLSRLTEHNKGFAPDRIKQIRFLFDKTPKGVIILDEVGFRN